MVSSDYDIRCSVVVLRKHAVLLVHRTRDGLDDWVLPGGTPREGESITGCVRREPFEETGLSAGSSQVALVVESVPPASGKGPVRSEALSCRCSGTTGIRFRASAVLWYCARGGKLASWKRCGPQQ